MGEIVRRLPDQKDSAASQTVATAQIEPKSASASRHNVNLLIITNSKLLLINAYEPAAINYTLNASISNNPSVWPMNLFGQGRGLCGSRGGRAAAGHDRMRQMMKYIRNKVTGF